MGDVNITADGNQAASADALNINSGLFAAGLTIASATVGRGTVAQMTSDTNIDTGGAVTVRATSNDNAAADTPGGGVGGVKIDVMLPTATISGPTDAHIAQGASVTAGLLDVEANATSRKATTSANVVNVSVFGGSGANASATVDGDDDAYIGLKAGDPSNGKTTTINVSGKVTVRASSAANPKTDATLGGGGGLAIQAMIGTATESGTTSAYVGDGTIKAGQLEVNANDTSGATTTGLVAGGGILEGRGVKTTSSVTPTIRAYVGQNVTGTVNGDLKVLATCICAEGDSTAKDYGGGGIDVGVAHAIVYTNPTVDAHIDTGSIITATGNVTVQGQALSQPAPGQTLDDYIKGVDTGTGQITFPGHGLSTGDIVTYDPNGNSAIETANGPLQSGGAPVQRRGQGFQRQLPGQRSGQ